mmetsp:Transcript_24291/g.59672  ORF Transcript_24291/g.59672 Transcript_24291/m.59672 type:complete len:172 (-) Transcript_24291:2087-2602(-)
MEDARKQAARLLCFGFDGPQVNDHARRLIALGAGAVIIFARNIKDPDQVAELSIQLKRAAAPRPLLVMVDQEGGRVARFRGPMWTDVPAAKVIGEAPDGVKAAAASGYVFGRELRACYVDMDLAPVVARPPLQSLMKACIGCFTSSSPKYIFPGHILGCGGRVLFRNQFCT